MEIAKWISSLGNAGAVANAHHAVASHRADIARVDAAARRIGGASSPRRPARRSAA